MPACCSQHSQAIVYLGADTLAEAKELNTAARQFIDNNKSLASVSSIVNLSAIKDGHTSAVIYFAMAGGAFIIATMLPRLSSFTFGPIGISATLKDLKNKVSALQNAIDRHEAAMRLQADHS